MLQEGIVSPLKIKPLLNELSSHNLLTTSIPSTSTKLPTTIFTSIRVLSPPPTILISLLSQARTKKRKPPLPTHPHRLTTPPSPSSPHYPTTPPPSKPPLPTSPPPFHLLPHPVLKHSVSSYLQEGRDRRRRRRKTEALNPGGGGGGGGGMEQKET